MPWQIEWAQGAFAVPDVECSARHAAPRSSAPAGCPWRQAVAARTPRGPAGLPERLAGPVRWRPCRCTAGAGGHRCCDKTCPDLHVSDRGQVVGRSLAANFASAVLVLAQASGSTQGGSLRDDQGGRSGPITTSRSGAVPGHGRGISCLLPAASAAYLQAHLTCHQGADGWRGEPTVGVAARGVGAARRHSPPLLRRGAAGGQAADAAAAEVQAAPAAARVEGAAPRLLQGTARDRMLTQHC